MKKIIELLLMFVSLFVLVSCGTTDEPEKPQVKAMTYAEYLAAEAKSDVIIDTFIQAKQGWWEKDGIGGVASFYTMDKDGGYFIYNMPCSKDDYDKKLVVGAKIRVTGKKAVYNGLAEIAEGATFELLEGTYVAKAVELTAQQYEEAVKYQNQFFSLKGLEVVEFGEDLEGNALSFGYGYDGSRERGDDAYFKAKVGDKVYSFLVESYLCDKDTDVYKAVEALKIGDKIDIEGFMYWYNGPQPHITKLVNNGGAQVTKAMTYAEYKAAEAKSDVVIETYIQAKQSWWEKDGIGGVASFYTMDEDGGYFIYNMPCSKDDYDKKLVVGAKIRVTGKKAVYNGLLEISEGATYELLEGTYVAKAKELSSDEFNTKAADYMNQFISLKGAVVMAFDNAGAAFGYKWNGAGSQGDDAYFNVLVGDQLYTFLVESYLCDKDTDVYKAVEALKVGDIIDLEGFMYWYDNPQPHVTKLTVSGNSFTKAEGTMTYAEYMAAEAKSDVVIETFIQAKQSWWEKDGIGGVASFYTMDENGGYFIYNMPCSKDDYDNKLVVGAKIKVTGKKAIYNDLAEISEGATYELLNGAYIAKAKELSSDEFNTKAADYMNQFISLKGAVVMAFDDAGAAFGYKWNGSGSQGDDAYFKVKIGETEYTFLVESYLCDKDTDVYKAVEALKVGDVIDLEGFMYWYNVPQPHVTSISVLK